MQKALEPRQDVNRNPTKSLDNKIRVWVIFVLTQVYIQDQSTKQLLPGKFYRTTVRNAQGFLKYSSLTTIWSALTVSQAS